MDPTGSLDAKFAEENGWNIYHNKMIMMVIGITDPPNSKVSTPKQRATLGRFYAQATCDLLLQDACENRAGWPSSWEQRKKGPAL